MNPGGPGAVGAGEVFGPSSSAKTSVLEKIPKLWLGSWDGRLSSRGRVMEILYYIGTEQLCAGRLAKPWL